VWDRIAAAVTHRRSWAITLLIAPGAGVFMALIGSNIGADTPPPAAAAVDRIGKGGSTIEDFSRRKSGAGDYGGIPAQRICANTWRSKPRRLRAAG
jgi:hypothetical protein